MRIILNCWISRFENSVQILMLIFKTNVWSLLQGCARQRIRDSRNDIKSWNVTFPPLRQRSREADPKCRSCRRTKHAVFGPGDWFGIRVRKARFRNDVSTDALFLMKLFETRWTGCCVFGCGTLSWTRVDKSFIRKRGVHGCLFSEWSFQNLVGSGAASLDAVPGS